MNLFEKFHENPQTLPNDHYQALEENSSTCKATEELHQLRKQASKSPAKAEKFLRQIEQSIQFPVFDRFRDIIFVFRGGAFAGMAILDRKSDGQTQVYDLVYTTLSGLQHEAKLQVPADSSQAAIIHWIRDLEDVSLNGEKRLQAPEIARHRVEGNPARKRYLRDASGRQLHPLCFLLNIGEHGSSDHKRSQQGFTVRTQDVLDYIHSTAKWMQELHSLKQKSVKIEDFTSFSGKPEYIVSANPDLYGDQDIEISFFPERLDPGSPFEFITFGDKEGQIFYKQEIFGEFREWANHSCTLRSDGRFPRHSKAIPNRSYLEWTFKDIPRKQCLDLAVANCHEVRKTWKFSFQPHHYLVEIAGIQIYGEGGIRMDSCFYFRDQLQQAMTEQGWRVPPLRKWSPYRFIPARGVSVRKAMEQLIDSLEPVQLEVLFEGKTRNLYISQYLQEMKAETAVTRQNFAYGCHPILTVEEKGLVGKYLEGSFHSPKTDEERKPRGLVYNPMEPYNQLQRA